MILLLRIFCYAFLFVTCLLTHHILSKQVDLAVELLEDLLGIIQVCAHWYHGNAGKIEINFFDACNLVHLYPTILL